MSYNLLTKFFTYWHTIRHLKAVQIYGRLFFRLNKPKTDLSPHPPLACISFNLWTQPIEHPSSLISQDLFCFINEKHHLNDCGWDNPSIKKLWRYNLHYFDDLNAKDSASRLEYHRHLISRWIQENQPGVGSAWEPYPTSLRIVNWIKWALSQKNQVSKEFLQSLAIQTRWLSKRLEFHLLGNHLWSNSKALIFSGIFFSGSEADRWLKQGLKIFSQELNEQILSDGGHFELSPMYHAIALEDILDTYNILHSQKTSAVDPLSSQILQRLKEKITQMLLWLKTMSHPDGEVSFFNDSVMKIAPRYNDILAYAQRLNQYEVVENSDTITHLKSSGYIRVEDDASIMIIDVANVGPDYIPGHAHADTLSFELSLWGQRLLVNSGISSYENNPERLLQRGTASHNTVAVDQQNSSEVWSSFRVARRAYPNDLKIIRGQTTSVSCSHTGYLRLKGNVIHKRTWLFEGRKISITDELMGNFKEATAFFHLHPSIHFSMNVESKKITLQLPNGRSVLFYAENGDILSKPTNWYPEFGLSVSNVSLIINFKGPTIKTWIEW